MNAQQIRTAAKNLNIDLTDYDLRKTDDKARAIKLVTEATLTQKADEVVAEREEAIEMVHAFTAPSDAAVWERVSYDNPNIGALIVACLYVEFTAVFNAHVRPHIDAIVKGATQYVLAHKGFKAALNYVKSFGAK
jgi:hypothetical protein